MADDLLPLNDMQRRFAEIVAQGTASNAQAAVLAGYSEATASVIGSQLVRKKHIQNAIAEYRSLVLGTELAPLALRALGEVLRDKSARPGDRVRAAAVVLERLAKHEETHSGVAKDPSQMSVAELEGYIRAAESKLQDVTPRQADEKA